ncbi:methyl-accepting chemotaxis protein [Paenibacillus endophyticus]|uniref:Methyl-accepting chemotaxis protein n=1 Tax=Paenibacillus endophyticus TaxID=1294268 RepID=A0A7W5C2Y9_9BACL|nr:methyl-accepting chemotaxis protein [Paenibacillus endophyticus]MBB3150243.1 methyl-accepting chemotaxis protein [Paenibacillus endophyticus]
MKNEEEQKVKKSKKTKQQSAVNGSNAGKSEFSMKAQSGMKAMKLSAKAARESVMTTKLSNPLKSVGTKLFTIIFVGIIACVLTVGLLAYSQSKKIIESKVSDASFETIKQVANNMDVIYKTYEDLSLQILIDKSFHEIVRKMLDSVDDYNKFEASRNLSEKMQSYVMGNNTIISLMLLPVNPKLEVVTAGSASSSSAERLLKTAWFLETVELSGKTNWIPPQPEGLSNSTGVSTVGLSRLIKDTTSSEASYVLLMEVSVDSIAERYKDVNLGEGSQIAILDAANTYITNTDATMIGKEASITLPSEGDKAIQDSVKMKTKNNEEVLAAYKTFATMDWKLVGTVPVKELVKDAKAIQNMTWITVLIAAVIAIAIGILVIMTIAQPLVKLRNLMNEGASGNLTVRSEMKKRRDEIGELSDSFNLMMTQIKALAVQTTRSAEDVLHTASELSEASRKTAISAKEIAVATEEIAGGATSLAVEAEKGTDLTGNIDVQMKKVIAANEEMVRSAQEVEKASEQGTTYMGVLIQKTGMTEEMTRSMVEKVDALKVSTGSIVKILDVLNNLTKQTNILSLNATIEAARAGAAGKGFMVVADEIRKLADQSRQSIDVVGQITEKIRGEIDETVNVLSDAYPLFQEQIGSVKEANQIFLTVSGQMGQLAERLDLVTDSIGQLDQSQAVLADAMTNVSAVAEESSATSEEVASLSSEQLSISDGMVRLSEKLDTVSRELKDSLSQFKID